MLTGLRRTARRATQMKWHVKPRYIGDRAGVVRMSSLSGDHVSADGTGRQRGFRRHDRGDRPFRRGQRDQPRLHLVWQNRIHRRAGHSALLPAIEVKAPYYLLAILSPDCFTKSASDLDTGRNRNHCHSHV
jgi:hypothetical protein